MVQFIVYAISGLGVLWVNLTLWGFTAGPVNAMPYLALVGALVLFIIAPAVALFFPRVAACIALVAALLICPWPIFVWFTEHDLSALATFGAPPLIVGGVAASHLANTARRLVHIAQVTALGSSVGDSHSAGYRIHAAL